MTVTNGLFREFSTWETRTTHLHPRKKEQIQSLPLFLRQSRAKEKRSARNTQDDEIKLCCVQNENKYIYRLSTAVNHMRFE